MERPSVDNSLLTDIKNFRKDLHIVWNHFLNRYQFVQICPLTDQKRIMLTCENDLTGEYRHPNNMDLFHLKEKVRWDLLDQYPDPDELWTKYFQEKDKAKKKQEIDRKDYLSWWNKENKKKWLQALENLSKGILTTQAPVEKKIFIGS